MNNKLGTFFIDNDLLISVLKNPDALVSNFSSVSKDSSVFNVEQKILAKLKSLLKRISSILIRCSLLSLILWRITWLIILCIFVSNLLVV